VTVITGPAAVTGAIEALGHARRQQQRGSAALTYEQEAAPAGQNSRTARQQADHAAQAAERHQANAETVRSHTATLSQTVGRWAADWCPAAGAAQGLTTGKVTGLVTNWPRPAAGQPGHRGRAPGGGRRAAVALRSPAFPGPAWVDGCAQEAAFGMAVDWHPAAPGPGRGRDLLEAAIAATGLLSAALTARGVRSTRGWSVLADGDPLPPQQSLAAVPGHPLAEVAAAVAARIAPAPSAAHPGAARLAALVVGADGTHRAGPPGR
jgi:hypothetical protein